MLFNFFPSALACNLIVNISFSIATAVPYPTTFANSTSITFPSAAGTTGCPSNCTRNNGPLGSITWTGRTITATITAETIVHIVNRKNNSTRTETITNTEADLKDYTPLPTTKTTSVVLQFGTTSRTEILTFPSILYTDYPSSYTFCGTLPTTTAGVAQCLKYPCAHVPGDFDPFNSDSPVFAYPSHPPIPDTIQNISASYLALDPRGSTWDAVWSYDSDYDSLIKPLMPDMGAWNCSPYGLWDAPASVLNTALYLTATSTSTESGDEAGATPAPKASPPKEAPAPAAGKEPAKVEPQAAEVSQILANPFGVGKPAAVAEKPTPAASPPAASPPAAAAQAPSADQSPSDSNAGSNAPATNPASQKANSNADTSSNQAANDNGGTPNSPVANPASPKEGSSNVAPAPNEASSDNNAAFNSPASNPSSPQEGSSNNAAPLSIPGLNNQAATAVPAPAANAVINVVTTSTNAQGSVVVATSQVPGVIATTTNAQGSQIVTTLPVVSPQALANPTPVIINGHTLTINSQSHYVIAGQTLSPNTPLILGSGASTTPVVLQTSGIRPVLVIGSSTTTLNLPSSTPAPTTPPAITIGTQTITANAQGQYIVGSQTLTPGGEIVVGATTAPGGSVAVGGTTVSLAASASQVVVGTSTEGLAPYIVGGLGTGPSNGTGAVVPFLGGAERGKRRRRGLGWMAGLVGGMVAWWL